MAAIAPLFTSSLEEMVTTAATTAAAAAQARALDDATLLAAQRMLAEAKRHIDACAAMLAGETIRRSSTDSGLAGLARREGYRTPEALVREVTGTSAREAHTLIRVGSMINDATALDDPTNSVGADGMGDADPGRHRTASEPWLARVGAAVAAGALSVGAAAAIRTGLGQPGPGVSADMLAAAAVELIEAITSARELDTDSVLRMARDARDELDAEGVAERERQRRELRSFRRWRKPDGMTRYTWELDPEGAAFIDDVYDKITSPRRGGPRFMAETDRERAAMLEHDPRTTEQLASDGMLQLVQIAVDTRPTGVVGTAQPAVRVLVAASDLLNPTGRGWIEGQPDPVSIATVHRHICRGGIETIVFDGEIQPANLGRTQRTFNRAQRRLLAARDGGCRWPGCERPPEWTEAHHIRWWDRDNGPTDIDNGILLCRHHHLLLHDNGWQITTQPPPMRVGHTDPRSIPRPRVAEDRAPTRAAVDATTGPPGPDTDTSTQFWLVPPREVDPAQRPRPMPSKSRALGDALRHPLHPSPQETPPKAPRETPRVAPREVVNQPDRQPELARV